MMMIRFQIFSALPPPKLFLAQAMFIQVSGALLINERATITLGPRLKEA